MKIHGVKKGKDNTYIYIYIYMPHTLDHYVCLAYIYIY